MTTYAKKIASELFTDSTRQKEDPDGRLFKSGASLSRRPPTKTENRRLLDTSTCPKTKG